MYAAAIPIRIGSPEHRNVLARFFLESYVEYVPEAIEWPVLSLADHARLAALPFWQEAIATENTTSNTVALAAQLEQDPEVRKAIELQGFEEQRHARLLQELTAHYRIVVARPPPFAPRSLENDFLSAGFGECFDSFFAFGLFALAQRAGVFTPALIAIFEPVMQEEARHILFFVNWVQYRRSQLSWGRRLVFRIRCAVIILRHVISRIKTGRTLGRGTSKSEENFTMSAHQELAGEGITLRKLIELCLHENDRRLGRYDSRLRRPELVPRIAKLFHRFLPARV